DAVAFLVEIGVVCALDLAVAFGRDNDLGPDFDEAFAQMVGIIALVGKSCRSREAFDKVMGKGDVVALAGRPDQTDGEAKGFGRRMDLGAQTAPRPTQALGIRPPFERRAPAAC